MSTPKRKAPQAWVEKQRRENDECYQKPAPRRPVGMGVVSDAERARLIAEFKARHKGDPSFVSGFLDDELVDGWANPRRKTQ